MSNMKWYKSSRLPFRKTTNMSRSEEVKITLTLGFNSFAIKIVFIDGNQSEIFRVL